MTKSRNNSLVFFFSLEKPRLFVLLIFLMFPQFYFYSQEMPFLKVSNDQHFLETESGEPFFWMGDTAWELVHRLDKDTTGLMVVAKNLAAHSSLVEQLQARIVSREYEAVDHRAKADKIDL